MGAECDARGPEEGDYDGRLVVMGAECDARGPEECDYDGRLVVMAWKACAMPRHTWR
jgi:hypothetical protein